MADDGRHEVWFLTGSQRLYGDDTLRQVEAQSRQVAAELSQGLQAGGGTAGGAGVEVVWRPVLVDASSIHAAVLEANADPSCVGVVTWMHTFSPAKMWVVALDALRKPLLHLHTQAGAELPWATIDMDFMNLNQAAHGDREVAHVSARLALPRTVVAGHVSDPDVVARVESWQRAALGVAALRSLKVARFGDNMRDVADTEGDKVEALLKFGTSVNTYGVNDLVEVVDAVPDSDVDDLISQYRDLYDVAPELLPGGERAGSLRDGARIEAGLRRFLVDGGFGAFTSNFQDLGGLKQLPGLAVQRLMADGYGFGGEGDWKSAVLLHAVKAMAVGRPGGTSFMEDYTYHLVPGQQRVLGAHMLEVCPTVTGARPTLEVHPLSIGDREDPVRLRFTAAPATGLVVGLVDLGDRFRLVLNDIDVVEPDEALPQLPVACAVWTPRPGFATATESWLLAGGPHHTVLSTAVTRHEISLLAEMVAVELVAIGEGSSTDSVLRELRWNAAYHRLAARL